jgi:Copper amine oxidase, enzyme domain
MKKTTQLLGFITLVGLAVFAASTLRGKFLRAEPSAEVAGVQAPERDETPKAVANVVRQGFPAAQADPADLTRSETAWEVEWELTHPENRPFYPPGSVLRVRSAKFMWKDRTGKPQWITVGRMLELAEIYVPYDNGWTAFLDIHDMTFHITPARKEFLGPSCVLPGEILTSSNPAWTHTVHKEVHDDGIRWMSAETSYYNQLSDRARRGERMILWSTYYGANYRYLIEYGFSDDGVLTCRLGPTGRNLMDRQNDLGDTHLHIGCWRLEFDLGDPMSGAGGPKDNDILLVRRVYDDSAEKFTQVARPFAKNYLSQACEGNARWNAEEFTTIRAQSKVRKNAHGRPVAFDLIPHRYGAMRQLQPEGGAYTANMDFINYDFWVTHTESGFTNYIDVPQYAGKHRPLAGQPTTVWHCTPALHFPRSEDFSSGDGRSSYAGVALTFWTGFFLKPRDLFDGTPLYQSRQRQLVAYPDNP